MKQLVCEMCGGTDLVKDGGVFVCQTCGCKYSIEEARKMMVEGTVDVQGTVKIDRSAEQKQLIENYLSMCKSAQESSDTKSVVEYSDKILEIDPNNYEAWVFRALSSGWDSSLNNLKTGQVITAVKKALELAPEEKRYEIAEQIFVQGKLQIVAHLRTVFSLTSTALLTMSLTMVAKQSDMIAPVMNGWVRLVAEIPYLSSERIKAEIEDCKATSEKHNVIIATASSVYNGKQPYYETMQELTKEKIETASKERDEMYARRREAYWSEHPEIKAELESKKKKAEIKKEELVQTLEQIPELLQMQEYDTNISSLEKQLNSLGLFKGKEKKALQAQIEILKSERAPIEAVATEKKNAIQSEIDNQVRIIADVEAELNKER